MESKKNMEYEQDKLKIVASTSEEFQKHVHKHEHKCQNCDYIASTISNLANHEKVVHNKKKLFSCRKCDFFTDCYRSFSKHQIAHKKMKMYMCNQCDFSSTTMESIKIHKRDVHKKRYVCKLCTHATFSPHSLKKHVYSVHEKTNEFMYNQCDFSSKDPGLTNNQVRTVNLQEKKHVCNISPYQTSRIYNLKCHVDDVHRKIMNCKCNMCDYAAPYYRNLEYHKTTPNNPKYPLRNLNYYAGRKLPESNKNIPEEIIKMQCTDCDFSTAHATSLIIHVHLYHKHEELQKCKICETQIPNLIALNWHLWEMHSDMEVFQCASCDYFTFRLTLMTNHLTICSKKTTQVEPRNEIFIQNVRTEPLDFSLPMKHKNTN